MIEGHKYNGSQVDVWSSGIILYAMVAGHHPFEDKNTNKLYQKILSGQFKVPTNISKDCEDILKKVICVDPTKRLTTQ